MPPSISIGDLHACFFQNFAEGAFLVLHGFTNYMAVILSEFTESLGLNLG